MALVAALHALTAIQRAKLLLRDVVGFSAEETAEALGMSVPSINSALFRARTAIAVRTKGEPPGPDLVDPALLARYVRAWESSDVEAIVAMLRDDVRTTMPPRRLWLDGLAANAQFYRPMFTAPPWVTPPRIVLTGANGAPALAFYRQQSPDQPFALTAIQVLAMRDGAIARIDHFRSHSTLRAFGFHQQLLTRPLI